MSVTDNEALSRFELAEDGQTAFANYRRHGNVLILPHVESPPALRGKGTAGRLMEGAVGIMRARGDRAIPTCPYAVTWFQRHPGAADVLHKGDK
ncbi:MAG: N-acetyltransferase [Alphaproteobacteria bacterium]|nr:N-acetyltransferase [Alphaproteobacteria bacterium]